MPMEQLRKSSLELLKDLVGESQPFGTLLGWIGRVFDKSHEDPRAVFRVSRHFGGDIAAEEHLGADLELLQHDEGAAAAWPTLWFQIDPPQIRGWCAAQ